MRKICIIFIAAMLCFSNAYSVVTWDGTTKTAWTQGTGTEADPFIISSPNHLAYLAQQVNAGTTYAGVYFKQTQDFNLNNKTWTSIGTTTYKFAGNYDGGENIISNLKNGLFGYIANASLKNLTIDGTYSGSGSSMFVSYTDGATEISNCHNKSTSSGSISANIFGCIVGKAEGTSITIENCSNQGNVQAGGYKSDSYLGGIIGYSSATTTLKNCYNSGDIKMSCGIGSYGDHQNYDVYAAGLIGYLTVNSTIDQCYNAGSVTAYGSSSNATSGVETYAYGLSGSSYSTDIVQTITRCYNTGNITSSAGGYGASSLSFALCYRGELTACYVANCTMESTSTYSYSTNGIGFGGKTIESCYYAGTQSVEISGSNAYSNSPSNKGTAFYKSDEALKAPSMIPLLNMLDEYFTMDYEGINDGYPILKWQAGTRYNISATCDANRGSVTGGGEYPNGYTATLTATPKNGCTFVGWSDGNTDNPRTVTVSGEASYIAQFTKSSYIIYVNQDCTGNIE